MKQKKYSFLLTKKKKKKDRDDGKKIGRKVEKREIERQRR